MTTTSLETIRRALEEDIGTGDITSAVCVPEARMARGVFLARDLVRWDTGILALCLAPAVIAGGLLGQKLFPLASEAFYRRLALALLVGVAIGSLILLVRFA